MKTNAELICELKDIEFEAGCQIASERLAGNIVKEEFWKGEAAGLRIAISIIQDNESKTTEAK